MKNHLLLSLTLIVLTFSTGCSNDDSPTIDATSKPESITALRKVQLTDNLKFGETSISGVVISDPNHGNFQSDILAVQQMGATAGILLELTNAVRYEVGDEVTINLDGSTLHHVDGELRVKNLSAVNVSPTGKKLEIQPRTTDLPTLSAETQYWGPILVAIESIAFSSNPTILGGINDINDGVINAKLAVIESADFYNEQAPEKFDKIVGISRQHNDDLIIYPRTAEDLTLAVTEVKEDFEDDTSTSYDTKTLDFKTGTWMLSGGITASTSADLKNGSQSIRLRGSITNENRTGILEMEFDVENVKGIRLSHGIYPANAEVNNVNPTTVDLEISRDNGNTYEFVSMFTIDVNSDMLITEEVPVQVETGEKVRFRLVNSSTPFGNNNKPRISIDDFTFIY
ncbi:DUF5689 domain-containing protein [Gelidibacter maritimus]|uniref:Channel forming colicins domain-containing protein n=1 Tax=Gelidibacter maritimus TaxID=2761487 RepID=A0A7W2M5I8_9FLAO|nr:DUF5689 domain-containing protein [Gelidibacter maritimus]MBA6153113.1 hypothetical protein [Gelidibacter maritimus]